MANLESDYPVVGSVWRNTRRDRKYVVIGIANYTEDDLLDKVLVLYRHHNLPSGLVYARPLSSFLGCRKDDAGNDVKRFEKVMQEDVCEIG